MIAIRLESGFAISAILQHDMSVLRSLKLQAIFLGNEYPNERPLTNRLGLFLSTMQTTLLGTQVTDEIEPQHTNAFAPKHAFACKRLSILSELCREMSWTNPPRPIKETLELLSFELENIDIELFLEDETRQLGRNN